MVLFSFNDSLDGKKISCWVSFKWWNNSNVDQEKVEKEWMGWVSYWTTPPKNVFQLEEIYHWNIFHKNIWILLSFSEWVLFVIPSV